MHTESKDIVHWQDAPRAAFDPRQRRLLLIIAAGSALLMFAVGFWQSDWNFYLASLVFIAIGACIAVQKESRENVSIALREQELRIGTKTYPTAELAGFWLNETAAAVWIHVENRRSILPLSFAYKNSDIEEVRGFFLEVLPELEPRETTLNDRIADWLKI